VRVNLIARVNSIVKYKAEHESLYFTAMKKKQGSKEI
jgi:hypothetical protein